MKYLKTYDKLFEKKDWIISLDSDKHWYKVVNGVTQIKFLYNVKNWPKLPSTLKSLYVLNQGVETLPELPEKLIWLFCRNNKIKKLPELPKKIEKIYCDNNQLKELPTLPKSLIFIQFYNNPIEKLPNGMTKELLKLQDYNFIKENVVKWITNKSSDYNLLKEYLTEAQRKHFEKLGLEMKFEKTKNDF